MISSVAAALFWYSIRIRCCFASSRERTMIFAGLPALPSRNRRTSVFPSDPVPPVISIRLPSNCLTGVLFPFPVGCIVIGEVRNQLRPWRGNTARRLRELFSFQAPVAEKIRIRCDFNVQCVCLAQEAKKLELRNRCARDLIQAREVWMVLDQAFNHPGHVIRGNPGKHRARVSGNMLVVLPQKPLEQGLPVRELSADDGGAQGEGPAD